MKHNTLSGLYVITDPALIPAGTSAVVHAVQEALLGGAKLVQYRNKTASMVQQLAEAKALRALTREYEATFIINDSLELCLSCDADGLHVGQSDGNLSELRNFLGSRILGVTCHDSIPLAKSAVEQGADYCAFGAVFPSPTKPQAKPCALATLKEASKLPVPVCAIGGITTSNAPEVLKQGVNMMAVISGVFGQPSIRASAHAFASFF
jgi:thiamine-phosphate pyrophosphorylase